MAPLSPLTRGLALALAAWTVLTWGTRIPLAWSDDELTVGEKLLAMAPVAVFLVVGVSAGLAAWRGLGPAPRVVGALAVWSAVYWAIRLPLIFTGDHPVGFLVAHSVLAVVAGGLSSAILVGLARDRSRRAAGVAGA